MFLTIPTPPPVVATFKPKPKPPLICFIIPKLCAPTQPPVKPPEEVPIPGPLPVVGAGAAFLWSRKLRQRIRETRS